MQGVYENFLLMKKRDSMLLGINKAYEWFIMNDMINNHINQTQNYVLMAYLPYSFVFWHFQFANLTWPKIKFPSQGYEVCISYTLVFCLHFFFVIHIHVYILDVSKKKSITWHHIWSGKRSMFAGEAICLQICSCFRYTTNSTPYNLSHA